jgi:hypothetical protein
VSFDLNVLSILIREQIIRTFDVILDDHVHKGVRKKVTHVEDTDEFVDVCRRRGLCLSIGVRGALPECHARRVCVTILVQKWMDDPRALVPPFVGVGVVNTGLVGCVGDHVTDKTPVVLTRHTAYYLIVKHVGIVPSQVVEKNVEHACMHRLERSFI